MLYFNTLSHCCVRAYLLFIMATAGVVEQWVKTRIFGPRRLYFSQGRPQVFASSLTEREFVIRFFMNESEGR